jgi:nucleotide-binding universal stress UspA family protein
MFRNVLLGLDFSRAADQALSAAIEEADRHGGRLTILTAISEAHGWAGGPVESVTAARELTAQMEAEAVALQHRALERVPADLPVSTVIRRAAARAALLDALGRGCFDTLVLGASSCRRRVRLTRSLTRCLVARGGVPVLVVEPDGSRRLQLPRIEEPGAPALNTSPSSAPT